MDNPNWGAILEDDGFTIRVGVIEALEKENDVRIAKIIHVDSGLPGITARCRGPCACQEQQP